MNRGTNAGSGAERSARPGGSALEILKEGRVDLVLTDMMMPAMDGAELAAAIRGDENYRDTPILMMTSLPTALPKRSRLFDAVLRKPFTPDLLLGTIVGCLGSGNAVSRQRPNGAREAKGGTTA